MRTKNLQHFIEQVRACHLCQAELPYGARPVFQMSRSSKILIAGQAPGKKVHATGIPFDDPSGDRLRKWVGLEKDAFYDARKIAILPMGFCYPGTGQSGDLPPLKKCAEQWREKLLSFMTDIELVLVIGKYAMDWHIGTDQKSNLTETVKAWQDYRDMGIMPLPHPSPRNNIWLKKNAWFEKDVVPQLQKDIADIIA